MIEGRIFRENIGGLNKNNLLMFLFKYFRILYLKYIELFFDLIVIFSILRRVVFLRK